MNLVIDIGNSYSKIFIFNNNTILYTVRFLKINQKQIFAILKDYPKVQNIILSSVKKIKKECINFLNSESQLFIELNHQTALPITNEYKSPTTLGRDRLAAVVGANTILPASNVLVIDAGTAITYDILTKDSKYKGGNISPGLETRFKSLAHFTGKLPLVEKKDTEALIGNTTNEAILIGVQKGIEYEMRGFINAFALQYPDLKVILTGGDTFFFDRKLKKTIFAEPNLVSIGLNRILNYNVEKS